jgi:hypothetical protein
MFFDTLESRQMYSVSPTSAALSTAHLNTPAQAIQVNLKLTQTTTSNATGIAKTTTTIKAKTNTVSALQAKKLVTAVIDAQVRLLNNVLSGKLKNLKQDLSDLQAKVKAAGNHLNGLLGQNVSVSVSAPRGQLNALRGLGKAHDRLGNLLGGNQMKGSRNSQASKDPTDSLNAVIGFTGAVGTAAVVGAEMGALPLSAIFGGGGAGAAAVGTATGGLAAAAGVGVGVGVVIDTTVTAVQGKSIGDNWADVYGQAYYNATGGDIIGAIGSWLGSLGGGNGQQGGNKGTPLPSDVSNDTSGVITAAEIKGILAKLNSRGTPTGEEATTGGAINTGASGTGSLGSKATFTQDAVRTSFNVTARDMLSLVVRLTSRVNPTTVNK